MTSHIVPESLSDRELLDRVRALVAVEREATARLVAYLAELDARRLYLAQGYSSLFTYCTQALHLSEHAAYGRIEAARLVCRLPSVLRLLEDGSLSLTTLCLLAPVLTEGNQEDVLVRARHKSKRDVQLLVAAVRPKPDVAAIVRKLPSRATVVAAATDASVTPDPDLRGVDRDPSLSSREHRAAVVETTAAPTVVAPLSIERYRIQFTVSRETHEKLRRVQDLARHRFPNGDLAMIFDKALTLLLDDLERSRCAAVKRPRVRSSGDVRSRHVPAAVRRAVWTRDAGQCAFVGAEGRCTERGFLEIHHVVPFADGGETTESNLELRCRAHNTYEAERHFGPLFVREQRARFDVNVSASGSTGSGRTEYVFRGGAACRSWPSSGLPRR